MRYIARIHEREYTMEVRNDGTLVMDGQPFKVNLQSVDGQHIYSLLLGDHSYEVFVDRIESGFSVLIAGERHEVTIEDENTKRLANMGTKGRGPKGEAQLKAPMPGLVVAVKTEVGKTVKSGDGLIVLEAMKMENELRAPWGGTVKAIKVAAGDKVEQGQLLATIIAE